MLVCVGVCVGVGGGAGVGVGAGAGAGAGASACSVSRGRWLDFKESSKEPRKILELTMESKGNQGTGAGKQ